MAQSTDNSPARPDTGMAPELHNDEQDDARAQAQQVTLEAQQLTQEVRSPTQSARPHVALNLNANSTQDIVDHMRDMESSGRIDMDAYAGEPNHDDNVDKFGRAAKPDGLRGDGT